MKVFKYILLCIVIILVAYINYVYFLFPVNPTILNISLIGKNIVLTYSIPKYKLNNNVYCYFSHIDATPSIDSTEWILSTNNKCIHEIDEYSYHLFIKSDKNEVIEVNQAKYLGKIISLNANKENVYIAVGDSYKVTATYSSIGYVDDILKWRSENENIAKVDENGIISGINNGTTNIVASIGDFNVPINTIVTNLIIPKPNAYNHYKSYLPCGIYSEDDNNLLDKILEDRVNDAGYQTRAGVVAVARFIALEFPYKIRYFSENGRLAVNGVDGEGRYYHKGLYLNSSRYSNITKSANGPKTWGCKMWSNPSQGYRDNGFDCSGFVSWVLLNGGFDVGDIGAGLASHLDLTDYGERTNFNYSVVTSGRVKVGDLLSSGGVGGGHIAVIVGEDDNNYYVAESLWTPPNTAVVIMTYSKSTIFNRYYYVMLMDNYYKEDGNLTQLWY